MISSPPGIVYTRSRRSAHSAQNLVTKPGSRSFDGRLWRRATTSKEASVILSSEQFEAAEDEGTAKGIDGATPTVGESSYEAISVEEDGVDRGESEAIHLLEKLNVKDETEGIAHNRLWCSEAADKGNLPVLGLQEAWMKLKELRTTDYGVPKQQIKATYQFLDCRRPGTIRLSKA
ncbi:hypothetical protein COCNU_03G007450 [Cocos nucifera]|uniref:Uncharacterized protein n=1 Tax=Cocos nucifera TaxID=13894 RepID=A0A8K0I3E7_COCNU|nr:hypothetical protein COCNU_03G007450 [Cocos nucifera]